MTRATAVTTERVTATVRYFAGAKAAAGTRQETVTLPAGATLAADHGDALARVLAASSLLLDETAVHDPAVPLPAGAVLDVLPPFAGG